MLQTYIQGRVVIDQDVSFRFVDSGDSNAVVVSYSGGDTFDSYDTFLRNLQAQINDGSGNLEDWEVEVIKSDEGANPVGTIKFTTNHAGLTGDLSHGGAGTGSSMRRYMGHNSDSFSSGSSPFYFNSTAQATFYPERSALRVTRSTTKYTKMQMLTLGGNSFSQFSKDVDDVPMIDLSVSLQIMTENGNFDELDQFETLLNEIFDDTNSKEPFALMHGRDTHIVWFQPGYVTINYTRMMDGWNGAWIVDLSLETWVEN